MQAKNVPKLLDIILVHCCVFEGYKSNYQIMKQIVKPGSRERFSAQEYVTVKTQ